MRLFKKIITAITIIGAIINDVVGYGEPVPPPPPCNTPQCSSGTYCYSNTNICTPCPSGYMYLANPNVGVSSVNLWGCSICPAGSFSANSGSGSCTKCSAGFFSTGAGSTACASCQSGTFSSNSGQSICSSCSSCATGKYLTSACKSTADTVCTSCSSISNCAVTPTCSSALNSQCASCVGGYYLFANNNCTPCITCNSGTYETGPCTTLLNRQCSICTASCPAGQMLTGNCIGTSNPQCMPCPSRYYKTLVDGSPCLPCTSVCSAGYELHILCNENTNSICVACKSGFYKSLSDGSSCLPCTSICNAGYELNQACSTSVNPTCISCKSGFYKSLNDGSPCLPCTSMCNAGYEFNQACNPLVNPICVSCQAGFYKSLNDGSSCLPCTSLCNAGYELNQACNTLLNPTCVSCQTGFYKSINDGSPCLPCINNCGAGSYLTSLCSSINNPTCAYCPANTANPNMFSVFQSACITCPNGAISAIGSATCVQCPLGTATFGNINCTQCDKGTYADNTGSITCKQCPSSTFNNNFASISLSACIMCPVGYISSAGSNSCTACPVGTYGINIINININNICLPCLAGHYNNLTGQTECTPCNAGSANINTNSILSTSCIDCLPGTYSLDGADKCLNCPAGTSSYLSGTIICALNLPGTFTSSNGSTNATKCQPGYYSDIYGATNCTPCIPGYINTIYGATSIYNCAPCLAGTFASNSGSFVCNHTPYGYYQDKSGQSESIPCPIGTSNNNTGSTMISSCLSCEPGKYQNQIGSYLCIICPAGFYQNTSGQSICIPCNSGYYNTMLGSNNISACIACPVGTYSHVIASNLSETCINTPIGTYTYEIGSSNFTLCEPGSYQNKFKQTSCILCPAGKYNPLVGSSNSSVCIQVPKGHYSDFDGASTFLACKPGYWTNILNSVKCNACIPGTFAENSASTFCDPCPAGTFSLGSGFSKCQPIGNVTINYNYLTSNSVEVTIDTNFSALLPMKYSCSGNCKIYVNNIIVANSNNIINGYLLLDLIIGKDAVSVIFNINSIFTSSLNYNDWTCETSNDLVYCTTIPNNIVIEMATLKCDKDPNNYYGDPSKTYTYIINDYSSSQTYKFNFIGMEASVSYTFTISLKIINETFIFNPFIIGNVITLSDVPTGPVQNLVKYFIGLTTVEHENNEQSNLQIHWDIPEQKLQQGFIIGYNVSYIQEERSHITYGPNVNFITVPSRSFSVFTNLTTLIINKLKPDTNYTISVHPLTTAFGIGPGKTIKLKTQVSAPPKPPVPAFVSRKSSNVTVSWSSLTNETGEIIKAWIIAEPYHNEQQTTTNVVIIPPNSSLPPLPFPNAGIRGFFGSYNISNPCQHHILGFTFISIFSGEICGGFCDRVCEFGTPMLDPNTILPTNNQNLTNDNYLMNFNDENGTLKTRYVTYLTMKKRFILNLTNGGLNSNGKIMLGDGKINLNSLLNNTVLDPSLSYRIRFIVFSSETLYSISDPLEISPFQPPATSDILQSAYIGFVITFSIIALLVILFILVRSQMNKRSKIMLLNDEAQTEKSFKKPLFVEMSSSLISASNPLYWTPTTINNMRDIEPAYFDVSVTSDNNKTYTDIAEDKPYDIPNAYDMSSEYNKSESEETFYVEDELAEEDIFAVPSHILHHNQEEDIFAVPFDCIINLPMSDTKRVGSNGASNPGYFTSQEIQ